jgi:hypothetical protein
VWLSMGGYLIFNRVFFDDENQHRKTRVRNPTSAIDISGIYDISILCWNLSLSPGCFAIRPVFAS